MNVPICKKGCTLDGSFLGMSMVRRGVKIGAVASKWLLRKRKHVLVNCDEVTYGTGKYEHVPHRVAEGKSLLVVEEDPTGVEQSTHQKPDSATRGQCSEHRFGSKHSTPTHGNVEEGHEPSKTSWKADLDEYS